MTAPAYKRVFVEAEPTAPSGGKMRWTIEADLDVAIGSTCAMISIVEDVDQVEPDDSGQDALLLDLDAARWLRDRLTAAVAVAELLEANAVAAEREETLELELVDDDEAGERRALAALRRVDPRPMRRIVAENGSEERLDCGHTWRPKPGAKYYRHSGKRRRCSKCPPSPITQQQSTTTT